MLRLEVKDHRERLLARELAGGITGIILIINTTTRSYQRRGFPLPHSHALFFFYGRNFYRLLQSRLCLPLLTRLIVWHSILPSNSSMTVLVRDKVETSIKALQVLYSW